MKNFFIIFISIFTAYTLPAQTPVMALQTGKVYSPATFIQGNDIATATWTDSIFAKKIDLQNLYENQIQPFYLLKADNLNSLTDKATARTNLSVYSKQETDAKIVELASKPRYYGAYIDMSPFTSWQYNYNASGLTVERKIKTTEFKFKIPLPNGEMEYLYSTVPIYEYYGEEDTEGKVYFYLTCYGFSTQQSKKLRVYSGTEKRNYGGLLNYAAKLCVDEIGGSQYTQRNRLVITDAVFVPNIDGNMRNGKSIASVWNDDIYDKAPIYIRGDATGFENLNDSAIGWDTTEVWKIAKIHPRKKF